MATLAALKKQMAVLEAKMAKATKAEMGGAIAKVRKIMADFGLSIEHLTGSEPEGRVAGKRSSAGKKTATAKKPEGGRPVKYRDPNSGLTWSGVGRAPKWLATVKNRDAFLVGGTSSVSDSDQASAAPARKASKKQVSSAPVAKKDSRKVTGAKKVERKAAKSVVASAEAAAKTVTAKKAPAKKAAAKKLVATKAPAKKSASKKVAAKTPGKRAAAKAAPTPGASVPVATEASAS